MAKSVWSVHGFTVQSLYNGLAYSVTRESDGLGFFLQGDDASAWRDQYNAADESDDESTLPAFLHQSISDYSTH